jgi:hypothetical protein
MLRRAQTTTGTIQPRIYLVLDTHFLSGGGFKLFTRLHLVPRIEVGGAILTLPHLFLNDIVLKHKQRSFPSAAPLTTAHE